MTEYSSDRKMKSVSYCLRAAIRMSRPARWRILVSFLLGLLQIAASLSFVWASKTLVDIATKVKDGSLWFFVCVMAGIMLSQIALRLIMAWWERMNMVKTQNILRRNHFEHIIHSRWKGKESFHSADMVNRLEEDIRIISDLICTRVPEVAVTVCQLIAASIYALILAPGLIWLVIALMCVAIVGSRLFFKKLRKLTDELRRKDSQAQQVFQDNLRMRDLVLMLFGPKKVVGKLTGIQAEIEKLTKKRLFYNVLARGFMSFGFMGGYAVAFFWCVFGISSGTVTYGMMTAMLQLVNQVQRPISEIGRAVPAFIHAVTSIERLSELTDLETEEIGEQVLFEEAPSVKLENVDFSYPDSDEKVIDSFSYEFLPGKMTAIMGLTGAGKSTLMRLVMGLLNPVKGTVTISGKHLGKQETVRVSPSTRDNFMYVPQGNTLLDGTIRDNLLLVDSEADDALLEKVLRQAQADFVFSLPQGIDTVCGEDGSGLSEGQCQRIAVARALLKKGGVLLLDEATSALDSQTEQKLLKTLCNEYRGKKTIIFISHRDAVSESADNTLRL